MSESENTLRTCTRCLECHPVSFFNKDRTRIDGIYPQCKNCSRKSALRSRAKHLEARREGNRRWKAENAERHKEYCAQWQKANPENYRAATQRWRKKYPERVGRWQRENPERVRANGRRWVEENREKRRAVDREWAKANPEKRRAKDAKRRAALLSATPVWADYEMIALIYSECLPGYEVDHIYPLRGRNSCGLHVVENLQYLTASENCRKSNKKPDLKEAW